jgi:positive regulator of sigma E activity
VGKRRVRLAGLLYLLAAVALVVAGISVFSGETLAATVAFLVAAVGFVASYFFARGSR